MVLSANFGATVCTARHATPKLANVIARQASMELAATDVSEFAACDLIADWNYKFKFNGGIIVCKFASFFCEIIILIIRIIDIIIIIGEPVFSQLKRNVYFKRFQGQSQTLGGLQFQSLVACTTVICHKILAEGSQICWFFISQHQRRVAILKWISDWAESQLNHWPQI